MDSPCIKKREACHDARAYQVPMVVTLLPRAGSKATCVARLGSRRLHTDVGARH